MEGAEPSGRQRETFMMWTEPAASELQAAQRRRQASVANDRALWALVSVGAGRQQKSLALLEDSTPALF